MALVSVSDLAHLTFFQGVSPASLEKIASVATKKIYHKNQPVFAEEDVDAPIFFVLQGQVRIFRISPEGKEITIAVLKVGAPFNIPAAFLPVSNSPANAAALSKKTTLIAIAQNDFRRVVSETPELAVTVMRDLSKKLQHFVMLTYDLGLLSVRSRLAKFLLEHTAETGELPRHWTQQQIATYIGTAREVVSRTLRQFAKHGIITVESHRTIVIDRLALEQEIER